ncbi:hypothetical protein KVA01_00850 [Kocuria varians]|uniref:CHAD domain-containing protein n=1 Tax=Kocuria varians TaxID=1272 RepID=A0A4Y4D587_KOCVA|nr:CYTH and CHAD domain-containing protein [Kocuria varians]GEC97930.1 hypothetical protein KVA01_00850 [Kocuria varians]
MVTQQVEIERKYDVPGHDRPELALHELEGFTVGEPVEHDMSATYYDTADLQLARAKVALRRRRGGSDDGWHVKYQTGDARGEIHHEPLKTAPTRIPAALRKVLLGLTLGEELTPVATIDTHRTEYPVLGAQGQDAELCLDAVTARDERAGVTRAWFECEVELSRHDLGDEQARTVFDAVEAVLFAAGARTSSSVAKIARALGQDGGDVVRVVEAPGEGKDEDGALSTSGTRLAKNKKVSKDKAKKKAKDKTKSASKGKSKDKSAGKDKGRAASSGKGKDAQKRETSEQPKRTGADVLAAVLDRLVGELQSWDFAVRLGAADSVHQLRVRSRTLRSVLQASRGFISPEVGSDLEKRLKLLARVLGDARDQEVARERLDALLDAQSADLVSATAARELREAAEHRGDDAARAVRRELDSPAYLQLLRDLRELSRGEGITDEAAQLSPKRFAKTVLGAALNRVLSTAATTATTAPEDPEEVTVSTMAAVVGERVSIPGKDARQTAVAFEVLHETRKAAKSARYVSEALAHAHAKAGKKRIRAAVVAKDYQDDLGVVTDAAVMEEWLARVARSLQRTGRDRYAVGLLHGIELSDLRNGLLEAPEILEDLVEDLQETLPEKH